MTTSVFCEPGFGGGIGRPLRRTLVQDNIAERIHLDLIVHGLTSFPPLLQFKVVISLAGLYLRMMKAQLYPVIVGESTMVFEFLSEGLQGSVSKLVIYSKTDLYNFYNLGFGDKEEATGEINDEVVTNNGDSLKVLATVGSTLYTFTDKFHDALIFATGSTRARTRLYRTGITNNIDAILKDFEVFGLINDLGWEQFQKGIEYEAFLVKS